MSNLSYRALREQLVQAAQMLSQTGAISHSVHGNMNIKLPSTEQMLLASKDLVIHLVPDQ